MTSKTLTGLEAVLLMQEGGYVTDGQHIYRFVNTKIEASDITSFNKGKPEWKSGNVFNFNYDQYKEYTKPKPLTGWERVGENESYYSINGNSYVEEMTEDMCMEDKYYYEDANYFSTRTKQRRSTLSKLYSVSYNVLVMRMVVMRLVGKKLTRGNMEFGTMPTTVKSKSVVLGQFEISVKSTSSQKK